MESNKSCYNFKKNTHEQSLLDNSVDSTYVITLVNSKRIKSVNKQLEKYKLTKTIYIVENTSYKNCNKILPEQSSSYDLIDCYLQIFKHAEKENYNNILILEDDFIFSNEFKLHVKNINEYVKNLKDSSFIYYLGCLPWLKFNNFFSRHSRLLVSTGSHSCIYSKKARENILNDNVYSMIDWDLYLNLKILNITRYVYDKPLCYQTFPETENQKNWPNPFGIGALFIIFLKFLGVTEKIEPGTSFVYFMSNFTLSILFLIFTFITYILYKVYSMLRNNRLKKIWTKSIGKLVR